MLLTIPRHRLIEQATGLSLRILIDGQDVTDAGVIAGDDAYGWATVAVLDAQGRRQVDHAREGLAVQLVTGRVEFAIYEGERPALRTIPRLVLPSSLARQAAGANLTGLVRH